MNDTPEFVVQIIQYAVYPIIGFIQEWDIRTVINGGSTGSRFADEVINNANTMCEQKAAALLNEVTL